MNLFILLYYLFGAIAVFFLILPFISICVSLFRKENKIKINDKSHDFGIIITAYKNAEITIPLIESLLKQTYKKYHIYLVADECDIKGVNFPKNKKLTILNPTNPPLRLKVKSIIMGVEQYIRPHDYTVIFDADNLAPSHYLEILNSYAQRGWKSIQGQRTAKNLDTIYACADAIGEFYKNYIDRYVPYMIGSSSVISGSGMAIETNLYKEYLYSTEITNGKKLWKKMLQEDKILQNVLLRKNEKIAFAWNAIIYDEKIVSAKQVETQRSRWLFSYFQNLPNSSGLLLKGLLTFNWNQIYFGLITMAPPLFILLFYSIILGLFGLFVSYQWFLLLFISLIIFSSTILWTLWLSNVPKSVWQGITGLPIFIFSQFKALFKMSNPDKNFKHSEHSRKISLDEVVKKNQ